MNNLRRKNTSCVKHLSKYEKFLIENKLHKLRCGLF